MVEYSMWPKKAEINELLCDYEKCQKNLNEMRNYSSNYVQRHINLSENVRVNLSKEYEKEMQKLEILEKEKERYISTDPTGEIAVRFSKIDSRIKTSEYELESRKRKQDDISHLR